MARGTVRLTHVLAVVEHHIETSQSRKRLDRCCSVADSAHRIGVVGKLLDVTPRTRHVARHLWPEQPRFAFVTEEARQASVHLVCMREFGKILSRFSWFGRNGFGACFTRRCRIREQRECVRENNAAEDQHDALEPPGA